MQTHEDSDQQLFLNRLRERANQMTKAQQSGIAAGKLGEPVLAEWTAHGVHVEHRPDDEQGIMRISIGGNPPGHALPMSYCSIRGDLGQCIDLLTNAIEALKDAT